MVFSVDGHKADLEELRGGEVQVELCRIGNDRRVLPDNPEDDCVFRQGWVHRHVDVFLDDEARRIEVRGVVVPERRPLLPGDGKPVGCLGNGDVIGDPAITWQVVLRPEMGAWLL